MSVEHEIIHMNTVKELAPECTVLLKSNKAFPLNKPCKIALFGRGVKNTAKGGTGGGIVEVRRFTSVYEAFIAEGFEVVSNAWLDGYDKAFAEIRDNFRAGIKSAIATDGMTALGGLSMPIPEPKYSLPIEFDCDTAIYVLTRISGEGADRQAKKGDIFLSDEEIRDIKAINRRYGKFMLVLNVGGIVDLSPVVDEVKNILLLSQLGMAAGTALVDIVLGKAYPSGKLATTWAKWEDYSFVSDFGNSDDTRYREGIYIGYRYFDTAGVTPIFPFGFGLGYTDFEIKTSAPTLENGRVKFFVEVKNVGEFKGKETVQVYVSVPQKNIEQPYQTLTAFVKTKELIPTETENIEITFDIADVSPFDAVKCQRVLESGDYIVRVGNSSRNTVPVCAVTVDGDITIERLTHVGGTADFVDLTVAKKEKPNLKDLPILKLNANDVKERTHLIPQINKKAESIASDMTNEELAMLCTGYFAEGKNGHGAKTVPGAAGQSTDAFEQEGIPTMVMADGPAGLHISMEYGEDENGVYAVVSEETKEVKKLLTKELLEYLLKVFPDAANDGRGGVIKEQICTALPIETAIAQSWNTALAEEFGKIAGKECSIYKVDFWLAPALNMHRNPLCGRNFEYFSEDPYITGKMASSIVKGVQSVCGVSSTLKHFVGNEQETNRLYSNSIMSERALRDIYMKGFEIAVKEAKPMAIMSSYNLINGEHTSQRCDLMETVLREEWGFEGLVMSDWVGYTEISDSDKKHERACASGAISAGNDLMMPGNIGHYNNILNAINNSKAKYPIKREQLIKCATRIISVAMRLKKENKE